MRPRMVLACHFRDRIPRESPMNAAAPKPFNVDFSALQAEDDRTGSSKDAIKRAFLDNLFYVQGKFPGAGHAQRLLHGAGLRRCATGCCSAGSAPPRPTPADGVAHRRLPVGRVPARPAPGQQPAQPRHLRRRCARRSRELGLDLDELLEPGGGAGPRQRRPRPARRLLPRLAGDAARSRRSATASATSSASSTRRSATAGRSRCTDKWLRYGNPWEIARPEIGCRGEARRPHRDATATSTAATACAGCPTAWSAACPTTRRSSATASTPRTCCACGGPRRRSPSTSQAFNLGDYYGAVEREDRLGEHHQGALPERRAAAGQGAAAASSSTSSCPARCRTCCASIAAQRTPLEQLPREVRGPAQRHASGDRRRRADAPAGRRARAGLGRRPGSITRQTFAYTNHTLLPEALETWPLRAVRARCCRGTWRSSTRSTARFLDEVRVALPRRRGARRAPVAHRRGAASATCAWRNLACVGSHAINGVAALHTELLKQRRAARLPRAVAGEVQQQDQRRHAAPLARCSATRGSRGLITDAHRRRLGHATSTELRELEPLCRRRGVPRRSGARSSAPTSASSRRCAEAQHRRRASTRTSLFDVQVKRIHEYKRQHLNVLHIIALYHRLQARPGVDMRAAHLHLRRQGGAGLLAWPS